jgi:hypothetical protein
MKSRLSGAATLGAIYGAAAASLAPLALAAAPAQASAASPVLEFSSPGSSFPIPFTASGGPVTARLANFNQVVHCSGSKGDGELTGPRSALSNYVFTGCEAQAEGEGPHECKSEVANPKEIRASSIEAELVYVDQAKHEVAMLLNPHGGVYMNFKCGGEAVTATGPFLSPVDPINKLAPSFSAVLHSLGATQIPSDYEGANGERHEAIPMGEREGDPSPDTTGVELSFTIQPSVPLEIRAINAAEAEARQRQEDEAAAKQRQDEEAAALAAKKREEARARARKRHLASALRHCRKIEPGRKRARCVRRAHKKYGARRGITKPGS